MAVQEVTAGATARGLRYSLRPVGRATSDRTASSRSFGLLCISLGAHMTLMGVLGYMPTAAKVFARQPIEIEVVAPPPKAELPPEPPPPKPQPAEPARPRALPKLAAPKPAEAPPVKPAAPPPAAAEAPVDFTGVTLTADGNSTWASAVGNGQALTGPAPRVAAVTGRDRAGSSDGVVGGTGPALVAEASLSRKPVPPAGMDQLLEKNYPPRARAQGVSGSALLAVRIAADGRVGELRILRETSDYGFGEACIKTLRGSRWQAPLDRRGNPVATDIRYSCDFEVGY